jgi:hypothetical protein
MKTSTLHTNTEKRLELMAREYQRQGYDEVILHPTADDLPQALRGLAIALVGYRESGAIVIADVRTRQTLTLGGNASLRTLADKAKLLNAEIHLVVIGSGEEEEV